MIRGFPAKGLEVDVITLRGNTGDKRRKLKDWFEKNPEAIIADIEIIPEDERNYSLAHIFYYLPDTSSPPYR